MPTIPEPRDPNNVGTDPLQEQSVQHVLAVMCRQGYLQLTKRQYREFMDHGLTRQQVDAAVAILVAYAVIEKRPVGWRIEVKTSQKKGVSC